MTATNFTIDNINPLIQYSPAAAWIEGSASNDPLASSSVYFVDWFSRCIQMQNYKDIPTTARLRSAQRKGPPRRSHSPALKFMFLEQSGTTMVREYP
jgi:hypothetical protein